MAEMAENGKTCIEARYMPATYLYAHDTWLLQIGADHIFKSTGEVHYFDLESNEFIDHEFTSESFEIQDYDASASESEPNTIRTK